MFVLGGFKKQLFFFVLVCLFWYVWLVFALFGWFLFVCLGFSHGIYLYIHIYSIHMNVLFFGDWG